MKPYQYLRNFPLDKFEIERVTGNPQSQFFEMTRKRAVRKLGLKNAQYDPPYYIPFLSIDEPSNAYKSPLTILDVVLLTVIRQWRVFGFDLAVCRKMTDFMVEVSPFLAKENDISPAEIAKIPYPFLKDEWLLRLTSDCLWTSSEQLQFQYFKLIKRDLKSGNEQTFYTGRPFGPCLHNQKTQGLFPHYLESKQLAEGLKQRKEKPGKLDTCFLEADLSSYYKQVQSNGLVKILGHSFLSP